MGEFRTLMDLIQSSTALHGPRPALGTKRGGTFQFITYSELGERIARLRAGLFSQGVRAGDRVAIISDNREEWAVVAGASYGLGAQIVPMYEAQLPREWIYILADSGAKLAFAARDQIVAELGNERNQLPQLQNVLSFEGPPEKPDTYAHLLTLGMREPYAPEPHDVAGFIYTSGTTGMPKGVLLSHANIISNINAIHRMFHFDPSDRSLSILPWAHSFGQVCELYMLLSMGCSIAINDAPAHALDNLQVVQPTVFFAVPRVFNKLYRAVHDQVAEKPALLQHLFQDGMHFAIDKAHGAQLSVIQRAELVLSDKLVFSRVRAKFGGKLKYAISASAALSPQVAEFVQALGITVYEGYGLTETSPIVAVNYPAHHKSGSVGQPIPDVRVSIDLSVSPDGKSGEIIVYGPNVMLGYHNLPEQTLATLTPDGGLRTGDLGYLDHDGYLFVTGRLKEQYKLENGKYIMPAPLEEQLKLSELVANVLLYGDNRPYNIALVFPNLASLRERAAAEGLTVDEISDTPALRAIVQRELDRLSSGFRGFERPRKCALLNEDFTCENGLLTPTLKLKRSTVVARYQKKIAALYAESEAELHQPARA